MKPAQKILASIFICAENVAKMCIISKAHVVAVRHLKISDKKDICNEFAILRALRVFVP